MTTRDLVVGSSWDRTTSHPIQVPLRSYTLRWWNKIRVPRLVQPVDGPARIEYDLCWAQTMLVGITEAEVAFLHMLLGPPGQRGHRHTAEADNWLLQRLMAGIEGVVYGIHLVSDTPEQARERQPLRTQAKDPTTAAQTYGGVVGTVLQPGVHPFDLGI